MAKKTNCKKNGIEYYRITISLGRDSDGKLIRKEFYGSSKKEAEQKRDDYLKGVNNGLDINYDKKTLGKYMYVWLKEYVKVSSKPSTYDRYEGVYRNYIKDCSLYSLIISNIKPVTLQRYYNELYSREYTSSQIHTLNKTLRAFFTYSVNQGYIVNNPCAGKKVTIPGNLKQEQKSVEVFEDNELKQIIGAQETSKIKCLSLLLLSTGMRRGEALGLMWSDIDTLSNEINIERSCKTVAVFDENDNKSYVPVLGEPKTENAIRSIPLPSSIIPLLEELKSIKDKESLKAGTSYIENDLLFCTEIGTLIDDSNLDRSFKRFLKRCGVNKKNLHSLRHTYATKQFELDVPLKTVSYLLGHSDIYITANRYTHVLKKHKDKAVDILSFL